MVFVCKKKSKEEVFKGDFLVAHPFDVTDLAQPTNTTINFQTLIVQMILWT
jgi:hypothetical protein